MNRFIGVVCLLISIFTFGQDASDISKLFPPDNTFEGWTLKDSIEVFSGDDLFYYINGGADIYLEYGFVQVAHCNYLDSTAAKIHLEIYEMVDNNAAYGIFTMNSSGKGNKISLGEAGFLYEYYLHYYIGNYYIRCNSSKKETQMIEAMQFIAAFPAGLITEENEKPALIQALDIDEFQFTQIKYFEGQLGLNNIFNFGHGSVAGFNEGLSARMDDKMIFVFAYTNDYKCREWFASAKGKMQMSRKFSDYKVEEGGFTVKDKSGNLFSFKSYGRFYVILKGYSWDDAGPIFEKIKSNLDNIEKK